MNIPKTYDEISSIVEEIECGELNLNIYTLPNNSGYYLQVSSSCENIVDGSPYLAKGRKYLLSSWMTDGEVVQTALLAVLQFVEHETREAFKWRGRNLFNGHLNIETLWENAQDTIVR